MCFLFNRTTLQVFVKYRTGALYMHPLWLYRVIWYSLLLLSYKLVQDVAMLNTVGSCNTMVNTGLCEMIVGVLTTCHTQYTWDWSMCLFLFNGTTLQGFVTYLTGALYVHPLWFYKHQHAFQVYCIRQVPKTLTISNNPVESQRVHI